MSHGIIYNVEKLVETYLRLSGFYSDTNIASWRCMELATSEGIVYIGNKPTPNYVLAIATQFNQGVKRVVIKARGRAIKRAVDAAELVKRSFPEKVEVAEVKIGSEEVGEPDKRRTVSTIEIVLEYQE